MNSIKVVTLIGSFVFRRVTQSKSHLRVWRNYMKLVMWGTVQYKTELPYVETSIKNTTFKHCNTHTHTQYIHTHTHNTYIHKYRVFNIKVDRILIWVIYLLIFTTCYITQLACIYSKCWKWCPFISMHLSTRFTMFLATFLSVLSFTSSMARVIFIFKIPNFSKKLCLQWA